MPPSASQLATITKLDEHLCGLTCVHNVNVELAVSREQLRKKPLHRIGQFCRRRRQYNQPEAIAAPLVSFPPAMFHHFTDIPFNLLSVGDLPHVDQEPLSDDKPVDCLTSYAKIHFPLPDVFEYPVWARATECFSHEPFDSTRTVLH
jgi:hypothetical protein